MGVALSKLSQKQAGAYYTPDDVASALVSWAVRSEADRLLDPSCGDGRFLAKHRNSVGLEQDAIAAHSAIEQAPWALVHEGDFFTWADETSERFECSAGNPPFIRYQTFNGPVRAKALKLCSALGASFSGLTSSWAPFLVVAASLLKKGGRMAFVVPAEIGHAPYAAPLIDYLVENFAVVHLVAVREKLFPTLSEDCWLLRAEGFGGSTKTILFSAVDQFKPAKTPPAIDQKISVTELQTVWNRRLRPYLLPKDIRSKYASALKNPLSRRFGDFAQIGIGYVSGDNDFFHLRPSDAERWRIPKPFLQPTVRSARSLTSGALTKTIIEKWRRQDEACFLLRLQSGDNLPKEVLSYLDSDAGKAARLRYKCRNRKPWYSVPDVQIPDFVMSYMSGRGVSLVKNDARVSCTNSLHSVRIKDRILAQTRLPKWTTPFVRLSCELEGHALGGGMLKLEPGEAARVLFPAPRMKFKDDQMNEGISVLQRWRHYAA